MTFWSWALETYARPGVQAACLDLQDRHGQSVPYLLWAAWAAEEGRALDRPMLDRGAGLAQHWETAAVGPLRVARRGLVSTFDSVAEEDRKSLRSAVKALELQAESVLMQALEQIAPPPGPAALPLEAGLQAATTAWSYPAPQVALRPMVQALT